jgi:hypothetical protein
LLSGRAFAAVPTARAHCLASPPLGQVGQRQFKYGKWKASKGEWDVSRAKQLTVDALRAFIADYKARLSQLGLPPTPNQDFFLENRKSRKGFFLALMVFWQLRQSFVFLAHVVCALQAGKLKRYLRSEPRPDDKEASSSPVVKLVGSTFEKAIRGDKDVLLEFYGDFSW